MLEFLGDQKFLFPDSSSQKGPSGFYGDWLVYVGLQGRCSNTWMERRGDYRAAHPTPGHEVKHLLS